MNQNNSTVTVELRLAPGDFTNIESREDWSKMLPGYAPPYAAEQRALGSGVFTKTIDKENQEIYSMRLTDPAFPRSGRRLRVFADSRPRHWSKSEGLGIRWQPRPGVEYEHMLTTVILCQASCDEQEQTTFGTFTMNGPMDSDDVTVALSKEQSTEQQRTWSEEGKASMGEYVERGWNGDSGMAEYGLSFYPGLLSSLSTAARASRCCINARAALRHFASIAQLANNGKNCFLVGYRIGPPPKISGAHFNPDGTFDLCFHGPVGGSSTTIRFQLRRMGWLTLHLVGLAARRAKMGQQV